MLNQELKYISAGENLVDLGRITDLTGIPKSKIANLLGVSRHSLLAFESRGTIRDARAKIISRELKTIKRNLNKIIKDLDQAIKEESN